MGTRYPNITVCASRNLSNSYELLNTIVRAFERNNVPAEEIAEFRKEATSGDQDNFIQTCAKWIDIV